MYTVFLEKTAENYVESAIDGFIIGEVYNLLFCVIGIVHNIEKYIL